MKALMLIPALAFFCSAAHAQEYSANRWKETSRLNENQEPVVYQDTVFMLTTDRQTFDVVIGGYAYRGTVDGDSLNVKKRTFQVISNEPGAVRLKFKKLTHVFTREYKGDVAADAEKYADLNKIPDGPAKKVNAKKLNGNWQVYKKQVRDGASIDIKTAQYLRKIEIYAKPKKGAKGSVGVNTLNMKLNSVQGATIKYTNTFNQSKTLTILRQTADEILVEDEQHVIYFLKK